MSLVAKTLNTIFIVNDEDFSFKIADEGRGIANLHCDVFKWTPRTLRKGYRAFAKAMKLLKSDGFRSVITITPNPKFALLFGGEVVNAAMIDGIYYEVIKWELK